jgi:hypothetical protein
LSCERSRWPDAASRIPVLAAPFLGSGSCAHLSAALERRSDGWSCQREKEGAFTDLSPRQFWWGLRQQPLVGEQRRLRAADISAVRESAISAACIFTPQAAYTRNSTKENQVFEPIDTNVLLIGFGVYQLSILCSAAVGLVVYTLWKEKEAFRAELENTRGRFEEMAAKVEELWLEAAALRLDKADAEAGLRRLLRKLRKEERRLRSKLKRQTLLLSVAAAENTRLARERAEYRAHLALLQAEKNWKRTAFEYELGLHSLSLADPDSCDEAWERLEAAASSGASIEAKVIGICKDGLFMDVGVPAFLPAAAIEIDYATELGDFLWQVLECRVVEVNRELRRVLLSRSGILFAELREQLREALDDFRRGEIFDGRVVDIDRGGVWVEVSPGVVGVVPLPADSEPNADVDGPLLEVGDDVRVSTVAVYAPPFLLALAFA